MFTVIHHGHELLAIHALVCFVCSSSCTLGAQCVFASMYWMKSISENDLKKHNLFDRKHLTEEEINSIHLSNISRTELYSSSTSKVTDCCGCAVMEKMGLILRIRQIVIYTAVIFYRRFYFSYVKHHYPCDLKSSDDTIDRAFTTLILI